MRFDYHPEADSLIELDTGGARTPGATQEVGGRGDHDFVIDVDEKGVPVSIDIHSLASSIVDLTK